MVVQVVLQQGAGCREACASPGVADDRVVRHLCPVVRPFYGLLLDAGTAGRVGVATLKVDRLGHVRQRRPGLEVRPDVHCGRLRPVEYLREQPLTELTVVYEVLQVQADLWCIEVC